MVKYDKLDRKNVVQYLNDILRSKILTYNISSLILSNSSINLILRIRCDIMSVLFVSTYASTCRHVQIRNYLLSCLGIKIHKIPIQCIALVPAVLLCSALVYESHYHPHPRAENTIWQNPTLLYTLWDIKAPFAHTPFRYNTDLLSPGTL